VNAITPAFRIEQIGNATLYLGDCREVLPTLTGVDVVLTDQPYGSGWVTGGKSVGKFSASGSSPQWDVWSTDWISLVEAKTYAAFCPCSRLSDLVQAFGGGQLRFYVKSNPRPPLRGADAPSVEPIVVFPRVRFGDGPQHFVAYNGDNEFHPTQKPLPVMDWMVAGVSAPSELVCDPFMGSGSTGVSCTRLGRRFVGIERSADYFDTACRRIEQAQRQADLFVSQPKEDPSFMRTGCLFDQPED
jgi:site-specific DNA-methyltransferase (adenine-specific)/modification methylase